MRKKIPWLIIPMMLCLSFNDVLAESFTPSHLPLASQQPPKPNILMVLDSSGSMKGRDMSIPKDYEYIGSPAINPATRTQALKVVVERLLKTYHNNGYLGFTKLGYTSPGYNSLGRNRDISILLQEIADLTSDSARDTAIAEAKKIPADSNTPLAYSIYEAAKHFRGEPMLKMVSASGVSTFTEKKPSPVRYRCQQQHMILLTDGEATGDGVYGKLGSDTIVSEGTTNLTTVARQLWAIDLRHAKNKTIAQGATDFQAPTDAQDASGTAWDAKGYIKLPLYMHAIRFGTTAGAVDTALQAMVNVSGTNPITKKPNGIFAAAKDMAKLDDAFNKIFQSIIATRSGAESFQDQLETSKNTVKYSNSYNPSAWTGEIKANKYNPVTEEFDLLLWSTTDTIKYNQGRFYTRDIATNEIAPLTANALGLTQINADSMVDWLKGANGGVWLRMRDALLGDIVESHPVYSAKDIIKVNLNLLSASVRADFVQYLYRKNRSSLKNLIIAGSNDGLINFIIADKNTYGAGERFVSYFPSFLKDQIEKITTSDYKHLFQINGATNIVDAKVGSEYKTIGITSLAAGRAALVGYTLYSIGEGFLSSGSAGSTDFKVNFEIIKDEGNFKNLGYTYSAVEFYNRKKSDGTPQLVAVFGNGFGNESKTSSVYFIDAVTGAQIGEIILEGGGTGGAGSPAIVAQEGNGGFHKLDRLYVGDYRGNLHRVMIDDGDDKITAVSDDIIFKTGGTKYPISARPALAVDGAQKTWVYFGTGLAADESRDKGLDSKVVHNFYGIKDDNSGALVTIGDLELQAITSSKAAGETNLTTTSNVTTASAESGWYIPLTSLGDEPRGERVVKPAAVFNNQYIHFVSWGITEGDKNDPCDPDDIFGKAFVLKLFTGNAPNLGGVSGQSGVVMEGDTTAGVSGDAPGLITAPGMNKDNALSGVGDGVQLTAEEKEGLGNSFGDKMSSHVKPADILTPKKMCGDTEKDSKYCIEVPMGGRTGRIYLDRII